MSESGHSEVLQSADDLDTIRAYETLRRRAEAASRTVKMRARHDAVYRESSKRILTPAQREDAAALERRLAKPFVDAMEERESEARRGHNIQKARVVLLSRLPKLQQQQGAGAKAQSL
eukprot:CAMPEP_0174851730 /NCGR_PEP_ID=MMETSP1114-20130205/23624_1 /TAXON_ID=312471 /ORGANISM="Neobodo designis, Strain CCAP 1951/1" /LENGTH=117 /DNA_ID=CAMNT_0016086285 /DNA_START=52 /DNA_END=401 /DNA_ORIENTATION=-